MVENDEVNVTAYVRTYKDPTGVLWHNFSGYDRSTFCLDSFWQACANGDTGMIPRKKPGWWDYETRALLAI